MAFSLKRTSPNISEANSMFSTQLLRDYEAATKVEDISIELIDEFENHPFRVKKNASMEDLIESIKTNGVQEPTLVRKKPGGRFEMISGHRRLFAAIENGLKTVPSIIVDCSDAEATIIMTDCNIHRSDDEVLPSEKAKAYEMRLDALKKLKPEDNAVSIPREVLAEEVGESRETVRRYIRLNSLTPDLMDMVDEKKLNVMAAVDVSYLTTEEQDAVFKSLIENDCGISKSQAQLLKKKSKDNSLSTSEIKRIINKPKSNQEAKYHIPCKEVNKFIPKGTKDVTEYILKALEAYASKN